MSSTSSSTISFESHDFELTMEGSAISIKARLPSGPDTGYQVVYSRETLSDMTNQELRDILWPMLGKEKGKRHTHGYKDKSELVEGILIKQNEWQTALRHLTTKIVSVL